jgi:hypothetical protein
MPVPDRVFRNDLFPELLNELEEASTALFAFS